MHPILKIFLCLLPLNFSGFISFGPNLVSTQDDSSLYQGRNLAFEGLKNTENVPSAFLESIKPIQDAAWNKKETPDYSSSYSFAKPIRAVIEATSKYNCHKPLTIYTALEETCLVNQSTQSLDVRILNPITVATLTGGILGNDVYQLDTYHFFWKNTKCNETHTLESRVYYFNTKYESFEKALEHSDGIVIANFPVATNGDIPSLKFAAFSKILEKKISEPGDYTKVHSAFTYTWYVNYPYASIYHTYKTKFTDSQTGKSYDAVIIELPLDPRSNYISKEQFKNTFGRIRGVSGESVNYKLLSDTPYTKKETHVGVSVINLPA